MPLEKSQPKKKILFIANHRLNRSPGQRFRFEQYIPFLTANGYDCTLSSLINEKDDKILYAKGFYFQKALIFLKTYFIRLKNLSKIKDYDVVFIFREALLTGSTFFEQQVKKRDVKIILDFDDAIWLPNVSQGNKKLEWLKNYDKTKTLVSLANAVIAGNQYLADYANQFNQQVHIIPTTIDTDYHIPLKSKLKSKICIGWTGSLTTVQHFELLVPVLKKIQQKYGDTVYFKLIGDEKYSNKALDLKGTKWNLKTEIEDLQEIDIGIMPLPDDEWAKGKCGFKGLQYMALEIPTIMSPVGVNTSIIENGVNGYLADSENEWIEKLSDLIESEVLRKKIGTRSRKTILEKYSTLAHSKQFLSILNDV